MRNVIVAGDVTVDWTIARVRKDLGSETAYEYMWGDEIGSRASSHAGGAALLARLIQEIHEGPSTAPKQVRILGPEVAEESLSSPAAGPYSRHYSVWSACHDGDDAHGVVWRATEFLGSDPAPDDQGPAPADQTGDVWGVIIDDSNLGFRSDRSRWPKAIVDPGDGPEWILMKMSAPVATGELWTYLTDRFADRLTLVYDVSDLRKSNLPVEPELSWERIGESVVRVFGDDPELCRPAVSVIYLGLSGGFVIETGDRNTLVYDPDSHHDNWLRSRPGNCVGYTASFTAAVAGAIINDFPRPDYEAATMRGVGAARALHLSGYADVTGDGLPTLAFPFASVARAIKDGNGEFATADPGTFRDGQSILSSRIDGLSAGLHSVAVQTVRHGVRAALPDVPFERLGRWSSVDREEIEKVRSLRNIVVEYVAQTSPLRPLSLAVFGPPGSGKSFAIKELAAYAAGDRIEVREFNLSQFTSPDELTSAFHAIRDVSLTGRIPLVLWDEFDTSSNGTSLAWLRSFLAPMQDGVFMERGDPHPLGAAIFIFAGGVRPTMAAFQEYAAVHPEEKGPDFVSRLRGYLDIRGVNPENENDDTVVLRRATLLRSLLSLRMPRLLNSRRELRMDRGVIEAFVRVPEYRYGARSMESIIDMSQLAGKLVYERSSLPPGHQLDLHVDADQFLRIVAETAPRADLDADGE